MPYNLPLSTVEDKNLIASDKAYLVCLKIQIRDMYNLSAGTVETLYLVNNNEDVTLDGQVYNAFNFDLNLKTSVGEQPEVTLTIQDVTRDIQYRMQNYNGGVGSLVDIIVVNESDLNEPPEIVENFEVNSASASDYNVTWKLGTQNLLAKRFPSRLQMKDRCGWTFKDPETCAYSGGATSCDLTLQGSNGCSVKGNEENFGGFPGIRSSGVNYA